MVCLSYILIFVEKKAHFEFMTVSDASSVRNLFLMRRFIPRFIPVKTAMRQKLPNPAKPCTGLIGGRNLSTSTFHGVLILLISLITCGRRCVLSHTHSWLVHITPGHGRPGFCSTEPAQAAYISTVLYAHISVTHSVLTHRVFWPQPPSPPDTPSRSARHQWRLRSITVSDRISAHGPLSWNFQKFGGGPNAKHE